MLQDLARHEQVFLRERLTVAAQVVVGADEVLHVAHQLVDAVLVTLHLTAKLLHG